MRAERQLRVKQRISAADELNNSAAATHPRDQRPPLLAKKSAPAAVVPHLRKAESVVNLSNLSILCRLPCGERARQLRRERKSDPLVFVLFPAVRVPARCASSALPQQNIIYIILGAHSSL